MASADLRLGLMLTRAFRTVSAAASFEPQRVDAMRKMDPAAREVGRRLFLLHQFLILQRHPRREQLRAALSELLFHLRVRRPQHFARDGGEPQNPFRRRTIVGLRAASQRALVSSFAALLGR